MIAFFRKHPVASYFTLAFAISWGGILAVIPGAIPAPPFEAEQKFVFVYLAMLAGPPVAGIVLTAVLSGREGLSEYRARVMRWRVPLRWYAAALLTAPLVLTITAVVLSQFSSDFVPALLTANADPAVPVHAGSRGSFVVMSLLVGIGAGFFEELGWTGFAIPEMRTRYGVAVTGVIVGLLWGAWHFLAVLWGSASAFGSMPIPLFMFVALFSFLPPYRVLMARVYDRTKSTLVAILMHASLTASMLLFGSSGTGGAALVYDLVFAAVLWAFVLARSDLVNAAHVITGRTRIRFRRQSVHPL